MKTLKNHKQSIILLFGIIIGGIIGIIFKDKATILNPIGDLFMNMLFVIIVPLIFLNITTSIAKIDNGKRLSKLLITIFVVFIITTIVACLFGLLSTSFISLSTTHEELTKEVVSNENINFLEKLVSTISVNDFTKLLSKDNIIALVIFSLIFGISLNKLDKKKNKLLEILEVLNDAVLKFVDIIFIFAPIGLGCFFASLVGTFGSVIAVGFLKTFFIYLITSILFFLIFYTLYAYIANGKEGIKLFYKNIFPAVVTSLSTCSSAASIPINIKCVKKMNVDNDVANTTIPLGTSFHKDGSVIGSVFKIMFLVSFYNISLNNIGTILLIIATSMIANLLIVAVPIGGGTISEMLILSMMGFPTSSLAILTIIATIIDAPATMLNVCGDTASSMMINKFVNKKKRA